METYTKEEIFEALFATAKEAVIKSDMKGVEFTGGILNVIIKNLDMDHLEFADFIEKRFNEAGIILQPPTNIIENN